MAVRTFALASVPYLLEGLLGAFEAEAPESPALASLRLVYCVALCCAFIASALSSPTAWFAGAPLGARSIALLFALGTAKTLLLSRHATHSGEAGQLLARIAPVLRNADFFTAIHVNSWSAFLSIAVGALRLSVLHGPASSGVSLGALALLTAAALSTRALNRSLERGANALRCRARRSTEPTPHIVNCSM